MISGEGRAPTQSYVEKINKFSRPKSVPELQRFLGTVNYYRCYTQNLAAIAGPLYVLTEKCAQFKWDSRCEAAFDELRRCLVQEQVTLKYPEWEAPFFIEADASACGVAAVLSQMDDQTRRLRPISYHSTALGIAQKNYSAGQLEAWALVSAVRKWSAYLKAAPEVVFLTEHNPLKWMRRQNDPKHTFARWLLELEEFPYRIEYRPGADNRVADYLSRTPNLLFDDTINREDIFEDRIYYTETMNISLRRIGDKQRTDYVIREVLRQFREKGSVTSGQMKGVADHLHERGGILYFDDRIVIP